jgi:tetratricopeptide (TPR) repeat protein
MMSKKSPKKRKISDEAANGAPQTGPGREVWLLVGILLLAGLVYSNSLANDFIYFDDPESVVNNPYIRQINLANLAHYFTTPVQYMYMPLAMISYAVDYQLGGLDPFIYHLTNLILHLGCVFLVYWVFLLLTRKSRVALFVSLLFAIHPVNVDSVAFVATRTNLLSTLFYLGALLCYSLYIEKSQMRFLALSCLSFLLAAGAKSSAVILPLILLLWDYFHGRTWDKKLLLEKIPFVVIALVFGILTLTIRVDAVQSLQYSPADRIFMFFYALADYGVRLLFPLQLSMSYAYPVKNGPFLPLQFYLAPLFLALVVLGLYLLKVSKKVLVVGLSFFVLNVILSQSVLLIDNFMGNRYVYLSYLGLYFILADINERVWSASPAEWRARLRVGWAAALVIFGAGFSLLTYNRNFVWYDSITLLDDVIQKQPGIAWAYGTRGLVKLHTNDLEGARRDFDQSLAIDPNYTPGLVYRADLNYRSQNYEAALAELDRALANDPSLPGVYRARGKVKLALQDNQGALDDFNRAIAINPQSFETYFERGVLKNSQGDYQGALADFNTIIDLATSYDTNLVPNYDAAFYMRGIARLNLNDTAGACADVATALSLGFLPPYDPAGPICP